MKLEDLVGKKNLEITDLKEIILKLNQDVIDDLIVNSTDDDKIFYNSLYNFSLQLKQKEIIEQGIF